MLETKRILAHISKVQYGGKVDEPDVDEKPVKRSSKLEVTFKATLFGDFLQEVESKYFPGIRERTNSTQDKSKRYREQLTMNPPELFLSVFQDGNSDPILETAGVTLKSPVVALMKGGEAYLFIRVVIKWNKNLDILKTLDQCDVEFSLVRKQEDLLDMVNKADGKETKEEEKPVSSPQSSSDEDSDEGTVIEYCGFKFSEKAAGMIPRLLEEGESEVDLAEYIASEVGKLDGDDASDVVYSSHVFSLLVADENEDSEEKEEEDLESIFEGSESPDEEDEDKEEWNPEFQETEGVQEEVSLDFESLTAGVPPLLPEASERPMEVEQVDFRLCRISSQKAFDKQVEKLGIKEDELKLHEFGQKAAVLAFERMGTPGRKVQISKVDVEEAVNQYNI